MANCLKLPDVPALPNISPFSFPLPPLPSLDLSIDYCCKLELSVKPEIPQSVKDAIKVALLALPDASAVILPINAAIKELNRLKNMIPLRCPFDDQAES